MEIIIPTDWKYSKKEVMKPKELIKTWVKLFNSGDSVGIAELYHNDAINHQLANNPVKGKKSIQLMFKEEFEAADMHCIIENLFEDGPWVILEWKDPNGLRGCGFFHILDNRIKFQRGYWDKLSFLRKHGLPIPTE